MHRVCVVGGGIAGAEAARESALLGAKVALFESSNSLPDVRRGWQNILETGRGAYAGLDALVDLGVEVNLGEPVIAVDPGLRVLTPSGKRHFDSVVVATGLSSVPMEVPGWRKPGVHVLESQESYAALREAIPGMQRIAVFGSLPGSLIVADRLADSGLSVSLFAEADAIGRILGRAVTDRILSAAIGRGVRMFSMTPDRIIGIAKAEAIVAHGEVVPCDGVVVIPRTAVRLPALAAVLGEHGGLIVDRSMRSTCRGILAAGDCVEFMLGGSSIQIMRRSTAAAAGRIAGVNATGGSLDFNPVGSLELNLFGVEVACAGLSLSDSETARLDTREVSLTRSGSSCWIVFERLGGKVLGVGLAGPNASVAVGSLILTVSKGVGVRELVYQETSGSTDISLVADTARQGLKACQRS